MEFLPNRTPPATESRSASTFMSAHSEAPGRNKCCVNREAPMDNPSLLRFLVDMRGEATSGKQLRDDMITFLIAGHETTASALTWSLFELAQNPELMGRLQKEVDTVMGDRVRQSAGATWHGCPYSKAAVVPFSAAWNEQPCSPCGCGWPASCACLCPSKTKLLRTSRRFAKNDAIVRSGTGADIIRYPDFEPQSNVSGADDNKVHDMLKQLVTENEVVLFMKGNPDMPQCGFSRAVAQALEEVGFSDYAYVDVLKYPEVREGVKKFSDWPTIPQLYVNAEFVGGCDIVMQMHKDGELKDILPKSKTSEYCAAHVRVAELRAECPTYQDIKDMELLRLCLAESLRMYPEPPLLIRRALDEDTLPAGATGAETKVLRGMDFFVSIYNLHRDEKYWPNPNTYDPDRFKRKYTNPDVPGWAGYDPDGWKSQLYPNEIASDYAFIPFGAGPRKCVGDVFAMLEGCVTLAMVVRNFDFSFAAPTADPSQVGTCTGATIHTKNGLWMQARERVVQH
eukprot:s1806_g4.t1